MSRTLKQLLLLIAVLALVTPASVGQQFMIAPGGPSGLSSETMYGPPFGLPLVIGPGPTALLLPPPPGNPPAAPGTYVVDALSSSSEAGAIYLFSVDPASAGAAGSAVAAEVGVGTAPSHFFGPGAAGPAAPPEAEGDIFVSAADFVTALAHPRFGIPALAPVPPPPAPVFIDEFALGLNVGAPGDDINGLMVRVPGAGVATAFYSLAIGGGTLPGGPGPFAPGTIVNAGAGPPAPFALAAALGLDAVGGPNTDDIDALIVHDFGPLAFVGAVLGVWDAFDFVAFSLAPGSPTLGAIGAGPEDVLAPIFTGAAPPVLPVVFIPGAALGLAPGDNLNALDVVPEPATLALLAVGGLAMLARRRRRTA